MTENATNTMTNRHNISVKVHYLIASEYSEWWPWNSY